MLWRKCEILHEREQLLSASLIAAPEKTAMNVLSKLFTAQDIVIDHAIADKEQLLQSAAQFLEWRHGVNAHLVCTSLQARENLGSTGIGYGIAIPHARIKSVAKTVGAFFLMPHGIEFDSSDGWPVKIAVLLLVPANINQEHLDTLAGAAKLFSEKSFRSKLLSCHSVSAIYQTIIDEPA